MTVHLVKLCVGVDTVEELHEWQFSHLKALRKARKPAEHCHRTMQTPKRRNEILDGGSLYWVIKGLILVRQRVLDLRADLKDDGTACCGIVLDPKLVATRPQARRPFQGWRYLDPADVPPDLRAYAPSRRQPPPGMREDLRELRLIDW
jgi:hypothetical protein